MWKQLHVQLSILENCWPDQRGSDLFDCIESPEFLQQRMRESIPSVFLVIICPQRTASFFPVPERRSLYRCEIRPASSSESVSKQPEGSSFFETISLITKANSRFQISTGMALNSPARIASRLVPSYLIDLSIIRILKLSKSTDWKVVSFSWRNGFRSSGRMFLRNQQWQPVLGRMQLALQLERWMYRGNFREHAEMTHIPDTASRPGLKAVASWNCSKILILVPRFSSLDPE